MEEETHVNEGGINQNLNTDEIETDVNELRCSSDETQVADFTAGPFVTRRNPAVNDLKTPVPARRLKLPPVNRGNATYDVTVGAQLPNMAHPSCMPSMSSFCGRPPIRLEFPSFGDSCETSDVLHFVEQVENYLAIRPLPSVELVGTLSTVLKGPAQSWWKAEKNKINDWQSFKNAFMSAFLPEDYLTEVEDKLRDFAYDYRALCLKWKPAITEEEMVSRILNNINPRVAGCLRGTVKSVEQLVKVGSMVEKDWMGSKDYWQKVGNLNGKDKVNKKPPERNASKGLAGLSMAQPHPMTSLLVVPITIKGQEVKAVLDTGSTYTLIQESLWRQLGGETKPDPPGPLQRFIMADGKMHQAINKKTVCYEWHDKVCRLDTYIMKDAHLAFPLIAGLDFLRAAEAIVDVGQWRYGLKIGKGYIYHPFLTALINPVLSSHLMVYIILLIIFSLTSNLEFTHI
ncbi:uncharacterized protein LOC127641718 [Xyrauchen texanus]|uniref:uncharacterized protein LOC127641718 n=1 Tax=Xyrauchen texanus TaxID=154827 RepID=UPI002241E4D9|nr:uncharacterized protein LOC127641718 [Xyrauchen texanus]